MGNEVAKVDWNAPVRSAANLQNALMLVKDQIATALPKHLTPERMMRIARTAASRQPKLLECTSASVIGSVIEASQLGLECDGMVGEAYLVPHYNGKISKMEAVLIPGYKGLVKLARQSGAISTIFVKVVRERDDFEYTAGLNPDIKHVPFRGPDAGEMVAVYAVAKFKDGGVQFEVMERWEIDRVKAQAKAKFGPWIDHYDEMAKKTVLRRLCKLLPMSIETQRAVALDELAEAGVDQGLGRVFVSEAKRNQNQLAALTEAFNAPVENPVEDAPEEAEWVDEPEPDAPVEEVPVEVVSNFIRMRLSARPSAQERASIVAGGYSFADGAWTAPASVESSKIAVAMQTKGATVEHLQSV